ncbi:amidohydrolase [Paenibacillus hemerocallicola]|uniref:Amidohydrolase n=1 Tax=Paenibacillus hemerocallicola TaxID=1172614 RepID=A0A5C4T6L5_9BACL|nr:amidohydrolase family protein [Paenibacillus hemerocallicola]TNJ64465.1 amidohydrolase [Paenibacillus hemerocallicola]
MIDAHIHLSGSDLYPGVLEEGDRLGVKLFVCSSVVTIGYYPTFERISRANDDLVAVMGRHPERIAGYYYVNPRHGKKALDDFRRRFEDQGMIGLKLWVATLCDDPLVYPFIERAIAYRAPILVHAWRKTVGQMPYETTALNVANLASRYPEARIIMAHMSGQVESSMNIVAPHHNVYTDTSGSPIGGGEVSIAVKRLGAERVIFGSDLHGADLASNIGKVIGAGLTPEQNESVMGKNMERLLAEVAK